MLRLFSFAQRRDRGRVKGQRVVDLVRFAHRGGVGLDRHRPVKAGDRDLEGGVLVLDDGVVFRVADLHVIVVFAAPDDLRRYLAVLDGELGRRLDGGAAGAACKRDVSSVGAVRERQAVGRRDNAVGKGIHRQRIRAEQDGAVVPLFLLLAECGAVDALIERVDRDGEAVGAVGLLGERDVIRLVSRGSLLAGAHVDIEIALAAHVHGRGHFAALDSQLARSDVEHFGAGLDGNVIGAVLDLVAGNGGHALLDDLLDLGHVGRRSNIRGAGLAGLRGGVGLLLRGGAAAAGGEHERRQKSGQKCFFAVHRLFSPCV